MNLIELVIDENDDFSGIDAISVVENPAIESDFVALKGEEVKLAEVDTEKRILMGAALIPDKPIYRRDEENEFYIFFSKSTVKKASELYLKNKKHDRSTLEHQKEMLEGVYLVESWIKEDEKHDKSVKYGLDAPLGTWLVSMKIENDEIWQEYVKTGKVKGFSIEGHFADKVNRPKEPIGDKLSEINANEVELNEILAILEGVELETYNDYPESAKNNAKKVLEWRDKYGDEVKGMTRVGWTRANQLAKGQKISKSTIARMASFKRHENNAEVSAENKSTPWKDAGRVAWLGWGGSSGVNWAINKLKSLNN